MNEEILPTEVSRGEIEILPGLFVTVVVLDDGRRIITEDSMSRFLDFLQEE